MPRKTYRNNNTTGWSSRHGWQPDIGVAALCNGLKVRLLIYEVSKVEKYQFPPHSYLRVLKWLNMTTHNEQYTKRLSTNHISGMIFSEAHQQKPEISVRRRRLCPWTPCTDGSVPDPQLGSHCRAPTPAIFTSCAVINIPFKCLGMTW